MRVSPRILGFSLTATLMTIVAVTFIFSIPSPWHKSTESETPTKPAINAALAELDNIGADLSIAFVENTGQWDTRAAFMAQIAGGTAWFEKDAITLDLAAADTADRARGVVTRFVFEGARESVQIAGEQRQAGKHSYFKGKQPGQWQAKVPGFGRILYTGLYDGIDLRVREQNGHLEYDLLLAPGADLDQVVVRTEGVMDLEIDAEGALIAETVYGPIRQKPPVTWQVLPSGKNEPVRCDYLLLDNATYGFEIPDRDPLLAAVIDPGLEWSTYFGGSGSDRSNALIVASNGDILFTGNTTSADFPTTAGAYDSTAAGDRDMFISRWNPDLVGSDQLIWSTLIGGSGYDEPAELVEHSDGSIIIVGQTWSSEFPVTSGALKTANFGGSGFITRLSGSGDDLSYSTYFGGAGDDVIASVALTATGIAVGGETSSADFPVTPAAFDTSHNGSGDAFLATLDLGSPGSAQLQWATFLGGSKRDFLRSLHVDDAGVLTATGDVESRDFPTTADAWAGQHLGGPWDGFVIRIDPASFGAASLRYSSYFGGSGWDVNTFSDVYPNGDVVIVGTTRSDNFPLTDDAFSKTYPREVPIYLTKLDLRRTGADQVTYSTFITSTERDYPASVSLGQSGDILVSGNTSSSAFPTTANAVDRTYNGRTDAFVFCFNPDQAGSDQLLYSTFLGTPWFDLAFDAAWDGNGKLIVGGYSRVPEFPTTEGAYQDAFRGVRDAFLSRISIEEHEPPAGEFMSYLDGAQQLPTVSTPGHARASFQLSTDSSTLHYEIGAEQLLGGITEVHIHNAEVGAAGDVVKTIPVGTPNLTRKALIGTWSSLDAEPLTPTLVAELLNDRLYVDVHTDSLPDGEIRGQIREIGLEKISRATPGVFYAPQRPAGGTLVQIEPGTGAGTMVGPIGVKFFSVSPRIGALAISSKGEMFTFHENGNPNLWRIDAATGAGSQVASTDLYWPEALAFDMNDQLYAVDLSGVLIRLDPMTGVASRLESIRIDIAGLAVDPLDNTIWASSKPDYDPANTIIRIDLDTGEPTIIGTTGFEGPIPGLAFDQDGNLFGILGGSGRPNDLIAIDKETGAGTIVGTTGLTDISDLASRLTRPEGPQISVSHGPINAGAVAAGDTISRRITVGSFGTEDLVISGITPPEAPFSITKMPMLPATLPPGSSLEFELGVSPTEAGETRSELMISSNDASDSDLTREVVARAIDLENMALAESGVIYGASQLHGRPALITVDAGTGMGSSIGPLSHGVGSAALAISSDGEIFMTAGGGYADLFRVDAASGAAIRVSTIGWYADIAAMAFDGKGTLYGSNWNNGDLYIIDQTTGGTTTIANSGIPVRGMAFDPGDDNILWLSAGGGNPDVEDRIVTLNLERNLATLVGTTGLGGETQDLAFDMAGNLYGTKGTLGPSTLIRIDKTTGAGTVIGPIGFDGVWGLATRLKRLTTSVSEDGSGALPLQFALEQNYPNPFNPSTTIQYDLPQVTMVRLVVYDLLGRKVRTLVDGEQIAGSKEITWNGLNDAGARVSSGIYLYRLEAGTFVRTRKMTVLK